MGTEQLLLTEKSEIFSVFTLFNPQKSSR